jgi:beta-N-acetylhexosaminidase
MDAQRGIARRMVVGLPREGLSATWEKDFAAYPPAGVIVFARDFRDLEDLRRLTRRLRELARPRRIFIGIDEEGGFVSQLAGHLTVPPNALLLARGAMPGDVEWASRITGERLRALGVDWVYAPVADIHSEPRNPVIGPRAYGVTSAEVTARVGEALRGFRAAGVATCLKHFPGHGSTTLDSHFALPASDATREELERRELLPFRAHRDADAVMTAHLMVPAIDPERPGTFSRAIAHDLLRGDVGFEGVCITDALEMKGASEGRAPSEIARLALAAGCDLLLFAFHDEAVRRLRYDLARALAAGEIGRESFDAARPRLARMDRERLEPSEDELSRSIASLTPADWDDRIERIVERGLVIRGALPAAAARGPWRVAEPPLTSGPTLREVLAGRAIPLTEAADAAAEVRFVMSRAPLPPAEIERLRAACARGPTILVGLQNDVFLDELPEAAVRVSAADATPLTRRVLARALAGLLRTAAEARV